MSAPRQHLSYLDGIRGIAILAVFLFHSLGASFGFDHLPWAGMVRDFRGSNCFLALYPFTYGFAGVAVFFAISGFCIHLSHRRNAQEPWGQFFHRRFFRIYPPYLLAIGVFFFLWPWGSLRVESWDGVVQLVSHVIPIQNFDEKSFFGINGSFWSIAVEIQLYAIYPLLIWLTSRFGWRKSLMLVGIIEVLSRAISAVHNLYSEEPLPRLLSSSPLAFWLSWSLGAYLCECYLTSKTSRLFAIRVDVMAAIAFLLPLFKPTEPFTFLAFSWLTCLVIERLMTGKWASSPRLGRPMAALWRHLGALGVVSYSFYLFHQPFVELVKIGWGAAMPHAVVHPLIKYASCLVCYPLLLALSFVIYRFIEQPSIKLGKSLWDTFQAKKAPAQAVVEV